MCKVCEHHSMFIIYTLFYACDPDIWHSDKTFNFWCLQERAKFNYAKKNNLNNVAINNRRPVVGKK